MKELCYIIIKQMCYFTIYNIINYGANMNFKQHTHEIMQDRSLLLTYTIS